MVNLNMDGQTIDGIFKSLQIGEIVAILLIIVVLVFLIKNLNKIIDARVLKHKEESKQLENENNALLKTLSETTKRFENIFERDRNERLERQIIIDKRFDLIDNKIENLYSITADQEEFMNTVSQGTLENMLFNESQAVFRRLKAFRRLVAMKANGRVKRKGILLVLENKETWQDVMDVRMDLKIIDQNYYNTVLAEIDKKIYGWTA